MNRKYYCGVDIGGTKLSTGLIDASGRLSHRRHTTDHTCLDEECLMDLAAAEVQAVCGEAGIKPDELLGVGVGMAGHAHYRTGRMLTTSNLQGFKGYPIADELSSRLGVRVLLDNDANCQALAEHRYGAGRGHENMVFITASTGIGAGIIINDRLYRGSGGTAGEIGHCIIEPSSASVCTCGNNGCFMAHACTLNLADLVRRKGTAFPESGLLAHVDVGQGSSVSGRQRGALAVDGRMVHEYAGKGDGLALAIIDEYADYLGILLYNVFQVLNPSAIVIGGGLMNWGDDFLEKIRRKFFGLARDMMYDPVVVVRAGIGVESGVIGAAALLLE